MVGTIDESFFGYELRCICVVYFLWRIQHLSHSVFVVLVKDYNYLTGLPFELGFLSQLTGLDLGTHRYINDVVFFFDRRSYPNMFFLF